MQIQTAIQWALSRLDSYNNPRLEAECLCAFVLKQKRVFLKTHSEYVLSSDQVRQYKACVAMRQQHIPFAYICGKKQWAGLELLVNESVLIPRDETEVFCETIAKKWIHEKKILHSVLDIGTGSGAIACFFADRFPLSKIYAVDISTPALEVAQKNGQLFPDRIQFWQSDLLGSLEKRASYDLLIANLPYIPEDYSIEKDVQKEPALALFSGEDGLDCIRRLSRQLEEKDIQYRELWLEFLPFQKDAIQEIFNSKSVSFYTDIGGDVYYASVSG